MNYLTTRRPMRNLFGLHNEMGRVFGDLLGSTENGTDMDDTPWMPMADICETEKGFEIYAELPGVFRSGCQHFRYRHLFYFIKKARNIKKRRGSV